jgi:hypothetical protein
MPPTPTTSVIEYETPKLPARRSWLPDAVLAFILAAIIILNLAIARAAWPDYHAFGFFALLWFCIGACSPLARIGKCRWVSILASMAISAIGFYLNTYFLAEITGSC